MLQNKSTKDVKKFLECKFMRVKSFVPGSGDEDTQKERKKLRFIRNVKFSDLYAESEERCKEWLDKLGSVMIRTDFHSRFEVSKTLGEGGFAKVYLGVSLADGKSFAIKALKKDEMKIQKRGKASIKNEVDVLQNLSHVNLMKLHEVHETKNSLYLVCEYLNGGSLVDHLKAADKFLTVDEILSIVV